MREISEKRSLKRSFYGHKYLADAGALLPSGSDGGEDEGTDGAIESDFLAEGPLTPQGAGGKIQGGLASQRGGESENRHE